MLPCEPNLGFTIGCSFAHPEIDTLFQKHRVHTLLAARTLGLHLAALLGPLADPTIRVRSASVVTPSHVIHAARTTSWFLSCNNSLYVLCLY